MNSDRENTIRIRGPLGRRAHAVALQQAERIRYLGDAVGETEMTFRKSRHARSLLKLQQRDEQEGLCE